MDKVIRRPAAMKNCGIGPYIEYIKKRGGKRT
jgi:hypothetical protein